MAARNPDIKKINGKFYDFNSSNISFLQTAAELKALGIKNYYFMLEVKNPHSGVCHIDPFDPNLSPNQIGILMREARSNMWFYIRELARIPIQGGTSVPYGLHRGLAAELWLFSKGLDGCLCITRQCYKTSGVLAGPVTWAYQVGTTNSRMHFFGKNSKNTKENLASVVSFIEVLPQWLKLDKYIDKFGKEKKARPATESISNKVMGNTINISAEPRNREHAQNMARGTSVPIIYYDEIEFTPFIDVIISNSAPAFKTAADNARSNNAPYGRLFTSTPGDLDTPSGKVANEIIESMVPWSEKLYDMNDEEIEEYISAANESFYEVNGETDKNPVRIFYIEYSYKQIRRTDEWAKEVMASMTSKVAIRREIFLQRLRGSSESPIDQEDLEYLISNMQKSTRDILLINKYKMLLYPHGQQYPDTNIFDPKIPYLIGIDCASGKGRDYSSMTVVNPYTLQIAAEFKSKYIGTTDTFRVVMDLIVNYIPRGIIIPEQNATGIVLIEMILESKIRDNLYYHENQNIIKQMTEESASDFELRRLSEEKKKYGTWVNTNIRNMLFELLFRYVNEHKQVLNTEYLVDHMCKLVVSKTGRIEHASGENDDCVFSWMHAMFVYEYGTNLDHFGVYKDRHEHPLGGNYELEIDTINLDISENVNSFDASHVTFESLYREDCMQVEQAIKYAMTMNPNLVSNDFSSYEEDEMISIPSMFFDQMNGF